MQPIQQQGRRFPSQSSARSLSMCWLLVSARFGQSTQQIHSLRARGVRASHAARTLGLAIRTRLRSAGTVCTTPSEAVLVLMGGHILANVGRRAARRSRIKSPLQKLWKLASAGVETE